MDPGRLADIFGNEREMFRVVEAIKAIETAVTALATKAGALEDLTSTHIPKTEEGIKDLNKRLEESGEKLEDLLELTERAINPIQRFGQALKGAFIDAYDAASKFDDKVLGTLARLQTNPEGTIRHMMTKLPFGNMLEIMFNAEQQMAKYEAEGRKAFLQFEKTGTLPVATVIEEGNKIGQEMKNLEKSFLATKGEVFAVYEAMAEGGLKAEEGMRRLEKGVAGFGNTIAQVSLGLDKAFQLAGGSSMKFATTLAQDTNLSIQESVELIRDLGNVSQGTALTMSAFVGTITQVTSALRVQGGDAEKLAMAYVNMEKLFAGALGDKDKHRASALAQTGLGGIGQFISGMSEGLKGWIGQGVGGALGVQGLSAIGGLRGMETGFQLQGGGGKGFEEAAAKTVYERLAGQARSKDDLYMLLTRAGGMAPLLAEAMIESEGGLFGDKEYKDLKEKYEKVQKEAERKEPLKTDTFEKMMENLMNVINAVGQLLATILGSILRAMLSSTESLIRWLSGSMTADEVLSSLGNTFSQIGSNIGSATDQFGEEFKKYGLRGVMAPLASSLGFREDADFGYTTLARPDFVTSVAQRRIEADRFKQGRGMTDVLKSRFGLASEESSRYEVERKEKFDKSGRRYNVVTEVHTTIEPISDPAHGGRTEPHGVIPMSTPDAFMSNY